jgi:hypothetical protein
MANLLGHPEVDFSLRRDLSGEAKGERCGYSHARFKHFENVTYGGRMSAKLTL